MKEFAYIHVHSRYSIQDSAAYSSDYVKKIHHYNQNPDRTYNVTALSLTDHGNMHGMVKHHKACSEPNPDGQTVKPIYGCEIYHCEARPATDRFHMVLMAKDELGLQNLYRIVSDAGVNRILSKSGRPFSISEEQALQRWGKGIIATSACLGGIIPKLIEDGKYEKAKEKALLYASYFDEFYLEVQPHDIPEQLMLNQAMVKMSEETGLPLVMGVDSHYVDKADKKYHDILKDLAHHSRYNTDNYLYLPEELEEFCLNHGIPLSAMTNTAVIANQCNVNPKPKNSRGLLPEFPVPPGYSEAGYLREIVMKELMNKIAEKKILNPITYVNRALYELDVICGAGFEGYFLILWDWFKDCRAQDILMGKGRGSAAGSLCCYALDITTIDPIVNGLIFERFLSPERLEFPDVDSDVSKRDRSKAIEYLLKRYGKEHVAQIITFSEYKLKNTIKAVNTAYGCLSNDEINAITTKIPALVNGEGVTYDLVEKIATEPEHFHDITQKEINECQRIYGELQDLFRRFPVFEEAIVNLRGAIASQGIHAGGVVVSGKPLHENIPIMLGKTDTAVLPLVQLAMEDLDFFKALKIDVLGLQTCTIIHDTMKLAGLDWDWYDNEDFFDQGVYEMLRRGETTDVFQMAKHTPRQMIKDFRCSSLEILTAINAGNRPGPLAKIDELGGKSMVELFKERTENKFLIPKVHPTIDKILEPTNGCLWYQEQLMQLGMEMAGYTLGGADSRIRKIMAKKLVKKIPELKNEFIYGKKSLYDENHDVIGISEEDSEWCIGAIRKGFTKEVAEEIFAIMEAFAKYSFNKSHSAAYAAIAYKTAYLSYYYPAEYAVACMSEYDDKEKILATLAMCRKRGIKILPPDINKSDMGFTVETQPDGTKAIRYGLTGIHKVGDKAVKFLMEARKVIGEVKSFDDYYQKFHDPTITVPILDELKEDKSKKSQNPLKKDVEQALILSGAFDEFEPNRYKIMNHYMGTIRKEKKFDILAESDYKRRNKLALEKEYMGTYISEHPLEPFPYTDLDSARDKEFVEVTGTVLDIRTAKARNGQYGKLRIEIKDGTETSVMLFGKVFEKYKPSIKKGQFYVFAGEWNEQYRNINASRVRNIVVKEMQATSNLPDTFNEEESVVDAVVQKVVSGAPVRNDLPLSNDDPFADIFAV